MRLRSVFAKTVFDRRHGLVWWSVGVGALTLVTLSVWPSVRDEYAKLVQNYPKALLAFFGIDKGGLGTAAGYLQAELFSLMLPLMLIGYFIAASSAATAGEQEAGTLEFLLAQPVSRRRVLLEKYAGLCASPRCISLAFVVALVVSTRLFDLDVGVADLAAATVSAYLLAALFGAVTLLAGCIDRPSRARRRYRVGRGGRGVSSELARGVGRHVEAVPAVVAILVVQRARSAPQWPRAAARRVARRRDSRVRRGCRRGVRAS